MLEKVFQEILQGRVLLVPYVFGGQQLNFEPSRLCSKAFHFQKNGTDIFGRFRRLQLENEPL